MGASISLKIRSDDAIADVGGEEGVPRERYADEGRSEVLHVALKPVGSDLQLSSEVAEENCAIQVLGRVLVATEVVDDEVASGRDHSRGAMFRMTCRARPVSQTEHLNAVTSLVFEAILAGSAVK